MDRAATPMTKKGNVLTALAALGILVVLVAGFIALGTPGGNSGNTPQEKAFLAQFRSTKVDTGEFLPDVSFTGPDGKEMRFTDFRGKYLVLNVWAAWCPPCLAELPSLQKLHDTFQGSSLNVIAVSADTAYTSESVRNLGIRFGFGDVALYHDAGANFQDAFALFSLPVTFIADPQGRILYRLGGDADWMSTQTLDFLAPLAGAVYQPFDKTQQIP